MIITISTANAASPSLSTVERYFENKENANLLWVFHVNNACGWQGFVVIKKADYSNNPLFPAEPLRIPLVRGAFIV